MRNYEKEDLAFYDRIKGRRGDLIADETGDLLLVRDLSTITQDIQNRMRTQRTDWFFHEEIGADLEKAIGQKNNDETAYLITQRIYHTLTYDGLVSYEDVEVDVVPISANEVTIFVFLENEIEGEKFLVFEETIVL